MRPAIARLIATGCFTGYIPGAPGTAGSALDALVIYALSPVNAVSYIAATILLTAIGVWAAHEAEKELGHDAGPIVIDEIVGVMITCAFLPQTPTVIVTGFVLFRIMDIAKPFPVNRSQKLPGGLGVVLDDVLAAVYAHVALRGILLVL